MGPVELARWQWSDYASFHRDRVSLALHLITVPLFWLSLLAVASWPWHGSWLAFSLALVAVPAVFAAQGIGHKREALPPKPFTSPGNALARLVMEQLVTFPRFLISGQVFRRRQQGAADAARGKA